MGNVTDTLHVEKFASVLYRVNGGDVNVTAEGPSINGVMMDDVAPKTVAGYLETVAETSASGEADASSIFQGLDAGTIEPVADGQGRLLLQPAVRGDGVDYQFKLLVVDGTGAQHEITINGSGAVQPSALDGKASELVEEALQ